MPIAGELGLLLAVKPRPDHSVRLVKQPTTQTGHCPICAAQQWRLPVPAPPRRHFHPQPKHCALCQMSKDGRALAERVRQQYVPRQPPSNHPVHPEQGLVATVWSQLSPSKHPHKMEQQQQLVMKQQQHLVMEQQQQLDSSVEANHLQNGHWLAYIKAKHQRRYHNEREVTGTVLY